MGISSTIKGVVAALKAAGLEAAADVRDLNPPGCLVTPDSVQPATKLCGTPTLKAFVDLVGRDAGDVTAYDQIDALLAAASPVLVADRTRDPLTFRRVNASNDPTSLPALRVTIQTPFTEETP